MTRIEVAPGYTISRLVKGGWQLAGGHGAVDSAAAMEDMRAYVEAGITTFDCADIYTGVEETIGTFRRRFPSLATRLQVHTKYVPDLVSLARVSPTDVEAAVDRSLRRLGVDSLDLLQFHWWDYDVPRYVETARALDDLRRKGKIRHLGATNFDTTRLREILDAGVPLIAHQVQYSLVDRRPEGSMAALCGERGLKLLCYGALLGGFFSQSWLDVEEPDEPLENRSLTKYKLVIDEFGGWEAYQRLLGAAAEVARKHATSVSAVGIRWVLDRAAVGAVIVGARDGRHLARTLAAEGLALDAEDRGRLDRAAAGAAGPQGDTYTLERVKGGRHAGIMRYDLNATSGGK